MSLPRHTLHYWLLAIPLALVGLWLIDTDAPGPDRLGSVRVPDAVLDATFVLPPNYTDVGFTPREMSQLFDRKGFTTRWTRQGRDRFILHVEGENGATGLPLDTAFQLRPVAGPEAVSSGVIGFTGPALIVESMAEQGIAAHWAVTTNLFEGLQATLMQEPGSRLNTWLKTRAKPATREAPVLRPIPGIPENR